MPVYDFRCDQGHVHEGVLPITSSERWIVCVQCGGRAQRLISAPGISRIDPGRQRLVESTRASAERPAVVDALPRSGRPAMPVSSDPRHRKLPRP